MSQAVESRCPEEKLVEHIRTVAMSALDVSAAITAHVESRDPELREKAELQENFLADYAKSLRENIVALVRHTRDFYANPLDYMTQQSLNNCLKEVAVCVKSLIEASRGMFCYRATLPSSFLAFIGMFGEALIQFFNLF
jgi:hypothetical protein